MVTHNSSNEFKLSEHAYTSRGVSHTKADVHSAIANEDAGISPGTFCKLVEDYAGDTQFCTALHADGAGTKSSLAYLYFRETGDISVFRGIAQDAVVMNLDDLICVGASNKFVLSNTIGRNAHRVGAQVIKEIIEGYRDFFEKMRPYGIEISMCGGETADVGDLVSTLIVDSTALARFSRRRIINCNNIKPGDVIVGLASFGKASYEDSFNSGIGSNGLTAARHILLSRKYALKYPETFSNTIPDDKVYCGPFSVEDALPGASTGMGADGDARISVGKALLSPTRTYLPVVKEILDEHFDCIHGIVHCTGGGQVKCKNFGIGLHYIKDNLFDVPPLFEAIKSAGAIPSSEMFQIFNMGCRMEIFTDPVNAQTIIDIADKYCIDAKITGYVEKSATSPQNSVTIKHDNEVMKF
ncbi:MAG: AIR synthase related protein [Oscillospiraceae bacterium]|nr:AIR synthase related protein [Oscillospiraceae bacterium]